MIFQADIYTTSRLEFKKGIVINAFTHIVEGAEIGDGVMIGEHCYVGGKAKIGDKSRVQNHNNIWDGVEIGMDCFIAPSVKFTNDRDPSFRAHSNAEKTVIENECTICTNVTIIAPCKIGYNTMIGAGSLVLKDEIGPNHRVMGIIK